MKPKEGDRRSPYEPQEEPIPDVPKGRADIPRLIEKFRKERNRDVVDARSQLFSALKDRGIKAADMSYIRGVAAIAYWMHRNDEPRFTKRDDDPKNSQLPYITHPLNAATLIAKNPHVPYDDLVDDVTYALVHDLFENTNLRPNQLRQVTRSSLVQRAVFISKIIRAYGGKKIEVKEHARKILEEGDIHDWRVRIVDWNHNLATTPKSRNIYPEIPSDKYDRLISKFPDTSTIIIPILRKFPNGREKTYWYDLLKKTYNEHKPEEITEELAPLAL